MADDANGSAHEPDATGAGGRRPRSVPLALAGLAALAVAFWGLAGPDAFGSVDLRWVLVAIAAVIGVALVAVPGRRKR